MQGKLFITGVTGFLGSEILRQSLASGTQVVATGRSGSLDPDQYPNDLASLVDYQSIDLADEGEPVLGLDGCDCVLHVAGLAHQFGKKGEDESRFRAVNVRAAERIAEAAGHAGVSRFVLVSSVGVYGPGQGVRNESDDCNPEGHYSVSKRDGEAAVRAVCQKHGIPLVILRMATLYGNGDRGNVQRLIRGVDRGTLPFIGAGENRKSLVHVRDAAAACLVATQKDGDVGTFNVAGEAVPMHEIYRQIRIALGKSAGFIRFPMPLVRLPFRLLSPIPVVGKIARRVLLTLDKWARDDAYDGARFSQQFQWQPSVSLSDGIHRQTQSYREQHPSSNDSPLLKRLFDVSLAILLLLLFAIPMLFIAVLVKLTSPGPVLYCSDRVGQANKLFSMPKYRSMRTDTPEVATHLLGDAASWITPLGRVLRKTSLDELPQLISVLKGSMSFVGPRPALFNQDDLIALRNRAGVAGLKPGVTGWAQINGRDDLSIPEKVAFDQQYLQRQGFWEDIRIILKTGSQAVFGTGVRSADETDGLAAWQEIYSENESTTCIVSEPENTFAVYQATSKMKQPPTVISLRRPEEASSLCRTLCDRGIRSVVFASSADLQDTYKKIVNDDQLNCGFINVDVSETKDLRHDLSAAVQTLKT